MIRMQIRVTVSNRTSAISCVAGLWVLFHCAALLAAPLRLTVNGNDGELVVNDGKVVLAYEKPSGSLIEVQQSRDADFTEALARYRGAAEASVLTGLAEGDYYFRFRGEDASATEGWSNVVHVRVAYMKRGALIGLLCAGLVVVLAIAAAIVLGTRRSKRGTVAQ